MQWRCIKAFGHHKPAHTGADGSAVPADVVDLPDGAEASREHYEPVSPPGPAPLPPPAPATAKPAAPAAAVTPKEGA